MTDLSASPPTTTLADRLQRTGALTPATAGAALADLGEALAALHAAGDTHGDVRPATVGFTEADQATLLPAGTPPDAPDAFIAPEQAANGPSPATDQFGLAATLVAMLTSRPPGPPEALDLGVPPRVTAVVRRALDPSPDGRFPDVPAFVSAVQSEMTGAADDAVAGVWEALEHRDYTMATMLCQLARRLRPDHPDIEPLQAHIASQAPEQAQAALFGGAAAMNMDQPDPAWQPPAERLADPEALAAPSPPPLPGRPRMNPWLVFIVGGVICLLGLIIVVLLTLTFA